jgi:hypothetical protein
MAELTFPVVRLSTSSLTTPTHSYQKRIQLDNGTFSDFRPTHGITAPLITVPKPYLKRWAAKMSVNATLKYFLENPETGGTAAPILS